MAKKNKKKNATPNISASKEMTKSEATFAMQEKNNMEVNSQSSTRRFRTVAQKYLTKYGKIKDDEEFLMLINTEEELDDFCEGMLYHLEFYEVVAFPLDSLPKYYRLIEGRIECYRINILEEFFENINAFFDMRKHFIELCAKNDRFGVVLEVESGKWIVIDK